MLLHDRSTLTSPAGGNSLQAPMRSATRVCSLVQHLRAEWRWHAVAADLSGTARQRTSWQLRAVPCRQQEWRPPPGPGLPPAHRHASTATAAAAMRSTKTNVSGSELQVVPEATANDWFRFTARPHEYWDHRATKQDAAAPDFTHQHDVQQALWLAGAPAWVGRLVADLDRRPDPLDKPCQLAPKADAGHRAIAQSAGRLRNPEDHRQWQARPEGAAGEALLSGGWWRFLAAPHAYYDHRRPASKQAAPSSNGTATTPASSAQARGSSGSRASSSGSGGSSSGSGGSASTADEPPSSSRAASTAGCDFSHQRDPGDMLALRDAPPWVRKRVVAMDADPAAPKPVTAPDADMSQHARSTAAAAAALRHFHEQPAAHQDFRELKAEGYKPGWYPDAVHTESGAALWLDAHSSLAHWQQDWWRSSEEATRRAERPQANDWFRFLQRPHEYFDYRSAKKRSSFPDFRHQHNSWDALWLEDAPQRVAEAVRQLDIDPDRSGKPVKVLTPEEKATARWAAFLADPDAWLDQRAAKATGALGPRHPDFVHSGDRRRALWLSGNAVPPEVHKVLTLRSLRPRGPRQAASRQ